MWAQLKDGFKEFATDALKEGGELVKDTADGTATAAAKVTEKAAVVTGTLSNRLDLDPTRAEEARGSAQGDVAGSSSRASKATTSVVDATRVASNPPAKPLASGVTAEGPKADDASSAGKGKKKREPKSPKSPTRDDDDVAATVAKAISYAARREAPDGDGEAPSSAASGASRREDPQTRQTTVEKTPAGPSGSRSAPNAKRDVEMRPDEPSPDALALELEASRAREAESDRRAVALAERLAAALAAADAASDGHAAAAQAKVKSLREDNEAMHRTLEDLKRAARDADRGREDAEARAGESDARADAAVRDMEAAEEAAAALRRQAAESEGVRGVSRWPSLLRQAAELRDIKKLQSAE